MSLFYVSEETIGEGTDVVVVGGDLDFEAAPEFKKCIDHRLDEGARRVILDLAAVGFIDSTAIGVVVGAINRLRESGGSLAVVSDEPNVRRIFDVVGLDDLTPLHSSRDDAISALAGAV